MKRLAILGTIAALALSGLPAAVLANGDGNTQVEPLQLIISEIQTGGSKDDGSEDAKAEFVELYNTQANDVVIDGWRVEFLTEKHDGISVPTRTLAVLNDVTVVAYSYVLLSYKDYLEAADYYFDGGPTSGYLPKSHGTVRLRDDQGSVVDMAGWGSPNNYQGQPAVPPGQGQSLQRCFNDNDELVNTHNNRADFSIYDDITPRDGVLCPQPENLPPKPDDTAHTLSCEGVITTELLSNPAGADTGKEFIELHNPTDEVVPLKGCSLQTTANSKIFSFGDIEMQPGTYKAFYDDQTGLTLANAAGGKVWLLTPDGTELQEIVYPGSLGDDEAWALIGNAWHSSYALTPNASNKLVTTKPCPAGQQRNSETDRCQKSAPSASKLTPCKAGQERSPATNRCRSVLTAASALQPCAAHQIRNPLTNRCKASGAASLLSPCKAGQIRNPQTNRCKAAKSSLGSLTPCKPGQTRNPETNRCKGVKAASTLKPCKEGQERNPKTNRCRKAAGAGTASKLDNVKDVVAEQKSSNAGWWLAGLAALVAIGYGMYEWRQDIGNFLSNLRKK